MVLLASNTKASPVKVSCFCLGKTQPSEKKGKGRKMEKNQIYHSED